MPVDDIIRLLLVLSIVVVPALGLTARFAIKPIVDAILRLRDGGMLSGDTANLLGNDLRQLRGQMQGLQEEVTAMREDMGRMREAESFHLALGDPARAALPKAETPAPSS